MQTGVVAGFGEVIGAERLMGLRAHGLTVIRQDLQRVGGRRPDLLGVVSEGRAWEASSGRMLYIVSPDTMNAVPDGSWVELLNEPEYLTPEAYAALVKSVWAEVVERKLVLWAGSIGNLDTDSLNWLAQVVGLVPEVTHIAVHRYTPGRSQNPAEAHEGYDIRDAEVAHLRRIIGQRRWLVSEVGYHTARRRRWLFFHTRLSARDQTNRLRMEQAFWEAHGAEAMVIYQENDAPGETPDQYGLRYANGTWKMGEGAF